jgi:cellulose synthase/poly-beta-1,6-N-acetylglucosamine synthase-like glycosyltransferase
MKNIEIPFQHEKTWKYRAFEILPGALSWTILAMPFILSFINAGLAAFVIISYLLLWFVKAVGLNVRSLQGFRLLREQQKYDWSAMLAELEAGEVPDPQAKRPKWHYDNLLRLQVKAARVRPSEITHTLIVAAYNETRDVLEPTIQAILKSKFDMKKVILVFAYEERGGEAIEILINDLVKTYGKEFKHAFAVQHPAGTPGEVIGKGPNITYAGRELKKYLENETKLNPLDVIVTTLDSDNRPHEHYLNALTYLYSITPEPQYVSYQPIPVYTQNIWDAPAPSRVIATGNTFWNVVLALRPHMIRNFASHAQSMQTLLDTDFWSVRTIVEDGHQFWRTYFRYEGKHEVYPLYLPVYQDAVISSTYWKTLKAQFVQLRRWAYGASDIAYVADKGFFTPNKVNRWDLATKFGRLLEGHISWATSPLILAFAAFIPILFNPDNIAANQLPFIVSRIQTLAMLGLFVTVYLSLRLLPPRPKRYKPHRTLFMLLQYLLFPITTVLYNGMSGLYSQTRLMFGKYMDTFDVTDKVVKK